MNKDITLQDTEADLTHASQEVESAVSIDQNLEEVSENLEGNPSELQEDPSLSENEPSSEQEEPKAGRWYILHTYSGFEQRVVQTIHEMMRLGQDEGLIYEIVVPTEKVVELGKGGKKRTTTRKFYPGYVMIRMAMTDYSWHLVQNIPKVTGFIGGKNRPAPMKPSEANQILALMQERQEQPRPKFNFAKGETIRVIEGPFAGFDAVVEDVNHDKGKLKASISIFGRQTAVELDFIQISQS